MPSQQYQQPEQDDGVFENDLPTYEDLAAQKGPNSRFGRWRGWVEKRAAERYLDITPEERLRRRERGWGDSVDENQNSSQEPCPEPQPSAAPTMPGPLEAIFTAPPSYTLPDPEPSPILTASERLSPAHLQMHSFGSRFLPHSSSQIRALLPILGDSLLLIGHEHGLSVLDMFPSGDPETSGPADAEVRTIWIGEGVYQLELLELEDAGGVTPQGVVLALVGPDSEISSNKDQEPIRSLRMYNLASLTSLARWAITQKNTKPLNLRRPSNWSPQQQSSPKRHKHQSSITKGIKSLIIESPISTQPSEPSTSYQHLLPEPDSTDSIYRQSSLASRDSSWDFVDDLPLRWATDFVPLAAAGSRLTNLSVLFFELKREEYHGHRGSALLAVATKTSILLYETPKGERAFRFVKELYTPTQPRTITFVHQRTQEHGVSARAFLSESLHLSPSAPRMQSARSSNRSSYNQRASLGSFDHGPHLSLFVTFDKKAGLIRIADAAVGEVEFYSEHNRDSISVGSHGRRSRTSLDIGGLSAKEGKMWLIPSVVEIPPSMNSRSLAAIYLVTRGKQTHVLPYPLPLPFYSVPPMKVFTWIAQPQSVRHRIYFPQGELPVLQLIGLGELGVEVQEISLSSLFNHKGKGRAEEAVRTQVDVGGDAGFLCYGGQWQTPRGYLTRSDSYMSYDSFDSSTSERAEIKRKDQGMYAWCRKGLEDWRVFWLGSLDRDLDI